MKINFQVLRRYLMPFLILSIVLLVGCRGCDHNDNDYPGAPGASPVVDSIVPLSGATDVALNSKITVTFSKPMAATNASPTFLLKTAAGAEVPGIVTYKDMIGKFTPTNNLAITTLYNVTISGARDTGGNALAAPFTASFTTGLVVDTTRPTVVSTNPADGSAGVPVNRIICVPFSELMDPSTVNASTFLLKTVAGIPVSGTVACVGFTAMFTPDKNFTMGMTYNALILGDDGGDGGVKDLAGNAMKSDYAWSFTGVAADNIRPTITSTDPAAGATNVATNKKIIALFSKEMLPSTIDTTTFTLKDPAGTALPGLITCVGLTANFTPTALLENGKVYTATLTNVAADMANNTMVENHTWSFTAGATADNTAPTVVSTDPVKDAVGVAPNQSVSVTFSEGMDSSSINTTNLTLQKVIGLSKETVDGALSYGGVVANFVPLISLDFNTVYLLTVSTEVKDLAGNKMAAAYTMSFTTGSLADNIAPTVVSTEPANGAFGVATNNKIAVTFSESMNLATLHAESFTITGPGLTSVPGTVSYANLIANFSPKSILQNATAYTGTITSKAKDLAGNALVKYTWTFTTGSVADSTAPEVVSTDPAEKAQNVDINKPVAITFSESMTSTTIDTNSFKLTKLGGAVVAGAVTCSDRIAYFNPNIDLDLTATYTALVTTGAKDLAGNALAKNYTWDFRTGAGKDTTAPTVTLTDPVSNEKGVFTNKIIAVTFSEIMDATSLKTSTFAVLKPDGTAFPGTVKCSGKTAQFTPTGAFANTAIYTVNVTSGVKDLAGNFMVTIYTWKFTTGALKDTVAPTVFSTDPAPDAINIPINKTVEVVFDETMNAATIIAANFTLKTKVEGATVPGKVSLIGKIAYYNPNADLKAGTVYTATVTTGAKDLAGNPLTANKTWDFTTGAVADTTAPTVLTRTPGINATNVAITTKVAVAFNEAMNAGSVNTTSFSLKKQGGAAKTGSVACFGTIATFTPFTNLDYSTTYTVTVTTEVEDQAGNNLAINDTWNFTTAPAPDSTAPTVALTDPGTNETGVAINKTISIAFSESMKLSTIDTTTISAVKKIDSTPVLGVVTLNDKIAKLDPNVNLAFNATYTVTIKSGVGGVEDLAGNALAADYKWEFTTGAAPDTAGPEVSSTDPANNELDVPLNQPIKATFNESVDPATINDQSFKIAGMTGVVTYDAITRTATFKPSASFAINAVQTATIASSVKDLAGNKLEGNTLTKDYVWKFTTGLRTLAKPVPLNAAAPFGTYGGSAGVTNEGILTVIHGDISTTAASTLVTGFHDAGGRVYTITGSNDGLVTGVIHTATAPPGSVPGEIANAGHLAANDAYIALSPGALPGGIDVSAYGGNPDQLANRTLKPGIYKSAPGSFYIQGGALTLDAQGDANAVWVFQMASTLTVGGPGAAFPQSVVLINGAQAKNVFWQVGSAATINAAGGGTMMGTIISQAGVTFSTSGNVNLVTLYGRALSLSASVTFVNTIVHIP